jgi:DUF218 domain
MGLLSKPLRGLVWLSAIPLVIGLGLFFWGGDLLVVDDQMPAHADVAAVLQGSVVAEQSRLGGAVKLWQRGLTNRILVSIPHESFWGQPMPPIALAYIQRIYGNDVAAHVDFCETSPDIDSTEQEAGIIGTCLSDHHWRSVIVVTSNYHTRRARMIWRRTLSKQHPEIQVWVQGVADPDFHLRWWSTRRSTKIWIMEFSKLIAESI